MYKRFLVLVFFVLFFCYSGISSAFFFGLKSTDNTVENIQAIEKIYNVFLPLVSFIFDPREHQDVIAELEKMKNQLGDQRIYHITISPNHFSAEEVAQWAFDMQYLLFFETIKRLKLKVIFRTMHEMNGWWYARASNPEMFKKAWIHVWNLSRLVGLTQQDLLFDFSINHWDMPTFWTPSQQAKLLPCKSLKVQEKKLLSFKKKKNLTSVEQTNKDALEKEIKVLKSCARFEDYFPWNDYVDIVGVTFYNRWKATSNRLWKHPVQILNDPEWKTLERLKAFQKPLFIDEVGTTAVWYTGAYASHISQGALFSPAADERKNTWLYQLFWLLQQGDFLGVIYFNVDYTQGLKYSLKGEADWAIIDLGFGKIYEAFWTLYHGANHDLSALWRLFGLASVRIGGKPVLASLGTSEMLSAIETLVAQKYVLDQEKGQLYQQLLRSPTHHADFDEAISLLADRYGVFGTGN